MSAEDFRINAFVRQVLSRCWIDTEALRFGVVGRTVYLHGRFRKVRPWDGEQHSSSGIPPEQVSENVALLDRVEKTIRQDPTVMDVVFRLDNFRKVNGRWSLVKRSS